MFEKEATRLYDSSGTLFATLGTEQRQKITYDENNNIKATAWLTDTSNNSIWSKTYKDTNGVASDAIGWPTIELFVESYNATHNSEVPVTVNRYNEHSFRNMSHRTGWFW